MSNDLPVPSAVPQLREPETWDAPAPGDPERLDGPGPRSTSGSPFERYLAAIVRHKWIILLVTVLGTGAGIVATRFVPLQYQAQATLWVEASGGGDEGPIRSDQLLESFAWIELLKSYAVLDPVVREQRLFVEPATYEDEAAFTTFALAGRFRPGGYELRVSPDGTAFVLSSDGVEVQRGRVGERVGESVGFDWLPPAGALKPDRTIEFTVRNPRDVAVSLGEGLQTRMAQDGNFLGISLQGANPWRIAATLNAVADRYVSLAAELKRAKLDELTVVLEDQRRYAEQNLHDAEIALESFRVETITLPSEQATPIVAGLEVTRDPVFDRYFEMRIEQEQLRADREGVQRVLSQIEDPERAFDGLAVIPAVREAPALMQVLAERTDKRATLRALEQRYTPEHRQVRALVDELTTLERQTIPNLAAALAVQLSDREAELEGRLSAASSELRQIPARAIEEARLRRQVSIAENLHTTLKQRYEEARLAAASSIPDIRLLDRPVVPNQPVQDSRALLALMGFAGSFGLAVLGVILLDRLDPRVRYPEQITNELRLPILGFIPNGSGASRETRIQIAESFRQLRLATVYAHGTAGPLVLTLTSPESGDGKSFVAANLALAFADEGHRTVLIDGDIRRGRLHHMLGTYRSPGLTDLLTGTAETGGIVQSTHAPLLSVIGSGKRMHNGPELLSSRAMTQLMMSLRQQFDVILIDSSPLGAGVDAYALGTLSQNVVLVLRTGHTNRPFTEAKLDLLERLPIRVLGTVLNDTPRSRIYRYHSYLPGYETSDEPEREVPL